jgi:2',3'-cyclic-nucleotide 2'-phosphodiesterase (5'-nucleotidase family)
LSLKLRKLAKNLTGVVDVIIGGHTHGTFSEIINGIPVIQSGAFGQELGRINLTEDGFKILNPIKLNALTKSDVFFSSCMYSFIPTFGNKVVTRARKVFPLNQDEIGALDYVLADSCYLGVKKHVRDLDGVILNKGSIRASIKVGDVTEYDLFDCMPFADNRLLVTDIPGYELLRMIEEDVRGDLIPANMSWSGEVVINGKKLQEMRAYRIVMSDYLVKMLKITYVRELELKQLDAIVSGAGTFLYLPYSVESRVKKGR